MTCSAAHAHELRLPGFGIRVFRLLGFFTAPQPDPLVCDPPCLGVPSSSLVIAQVTRARATLAMAKAMPTLAKAMPTLPHVPGKGTSTLTWRGGVTTEFTLSLGTHEGTLI